MNLETRLREQLEKLTKWRSIFAGWQLGTRILIERHLIEQDELRHALLEEAIFLDKAYEEKFPGVSTFEGGINLKMPEAGETMKGWRP